MVDLIFFISEIILILSYLFRNILYLRLFTIVALSGYAVGGFVAGYNEKGMKVIIITNIIAVLVNVVQVSKILYDRYLFFLPEDVKELYQNAFVGIMPQDYYKKLYQLSIKNTYTKDQLLSIQDEPINDLIMITKGSVEILRDEKLITELGPGFFIGEMSFLTKKLATATVKTITDEVECYVWSKDILHLLEVKNPEIFVKLQQVIAINLITKVNLFSARDTEIDTGVA